MAGPAVLWEYTDGLIMDVQELLWHQRNDSDPRPAKALDASPDALRARQMIAAQSTCCEQTDKTCPTYGLPIPEMIQEHVDLFQREKARAGLG